MSLLQALAAAVGEANVLAGEAAAPYLTDWRKRYVGRAQAVVRPASTAEVAAVVRACAQARTPMVPQGGNTGLVGGGVPDASGTQVLLSLQRMNHVRAIDEAGWLAMHLELANAMAHLTEVVAGFPESRWDDLVGEKYLLYVPNAGHGLEDRSRVVAGLAALNRRVITGKPLPKIDWEFGDTGGGAKLTVPGPLTTIQVSVGVALGRPSSETLPESASVAGRVTGATGDTETTGARFGTGDTVTVASSNAESAVSLAVSRST